LLLLLRNVVIKETTTKTAAFWLINQSHNKS